MKLVWELARERAESTLEMIKTNGSIEYPVDVEKICDIFGISIKYKNLVSGVSGYIDKRNKSSRATIVVNRNDIPVRQRFTIAHELGHFIERLTVGDPEYTFVDGRGQKYDLHEFFADEFAGALLMPTSCLLSVANQYRDISKVASFFNVSERAVAKRSERLSKNPDMAQAQE